jgi:formylglycine-generating enzyme required for sulfatase activity
MRDALVRLGFDVTYGEDLDQEGLRRTIGQFADRVGDADVAMVYFAGHSATFGDTSYVVPVDAEFSSLEQVAYELVPAETLIGELRRARGVGIIILDACHDNAAERELKRQASRGGPVVRGLAPMKNAGGLIIAYATQYLSTAADDAGLDLFGRSTGHSPFTAALLNNIATPGLDLTDMFRKVGREVDAATGGKQRLEIFISMYEQYALAPAAGNTTAAPPPGGGTTASEAAQAWSVIQSTTSLAVLDQFVRQFGNVPVYGSIARARREELANAQQIAAVASPVTPVVHAVDPCSGPVTVSFPSGCAVPLTAAQERVLQPKDAFRECENCPEMVVVPAGSFTMGSPEQETGNYRDEKPQHIVTIGRPFAVSKLHVTVDQFAAFVGYTGYEHSRSCSWRSPGFAQEGSRPVVCVNWDDANAYANWLAKKTGKPYRLLSEAEWEYAARGQTSPGSYPRFWFGQDEKDLCRYGNFYDQKAGVRDAPCSDGYDRTSPAGHYAPNAFGLHDMFGNAWQWTTDCYHDRYEGAPTDGSPWTTEHCMSGHVARGGSWYNIPAYIRAANRNKFTAESFSLGFRLARTLTP